MITIHKLSAIEGCKCVTSTRFAPGSNAFISLMTFAFASGANLASVHLNSVFSTTSFCVCACTGAAAAVGSAWMLSLCYLVCQMETCEWEEKKVTERTAQSCAVFPMDRVSILETMRSISGQDCSFGASEVKKRRYITRWRVGKEKRD
jgi:hypothetical protein